jgi:hypothetical protein
MKKKSILYLLLGITALLIICGGCLTKCVKVHTETVGEIHSPEYETLQLYEHEEYIEPPIDSLSKVFIEDFTQAVRQNNRSAIAKMIAYPLSQPYPLQDIANEKEFIKHYNRIFPKSLLQRLDTSTMDDWSQVGWRGIMFCNGHIWIDLFDSGVKIRTVNSDIDDNPQLYTDLENARQKERTLLGITDTHIIPFACYLSKDSTTLIHFTHDTVDGESYTTIYYNSHQIDWKLQANSQLKLRCSHEIQGSCANDFYKATLDNDTIEIWDMNCGGFDDHEEYAYGFHVIADTTSQEKNLLDTIGMRYNSDLNEYGSFALRPIYLQEIVGVR